MAAYAPAAMAQSTNAGTQLQQIPPTPAIAKPGPVIGTTPRAPAPATEPVGTSVRIDTLQVTGATLFDPVALRDASGFAPGAQLTLADMRALAGRIAAYYHARGHFLAQAYIPEQDLQTSTVTIAVIEGRYGKVAINNRSRVADRVANGLLRGLDAGDIVAGAPLERRLLLLSDLPGVAVRSTLSPGSTVGTSDLLVDIAPGRVVTGSVEADNAGNRYTGRHRAGVTINVNNPLGIGDQLSGRVLTSDGGLAYGRASYQLMAGATSLGVAYAHVRYALGREFEQLDADGAADIVTLYARYPLIRSRAVNVHATASLEAKWFEDRIGFVAAQSNRNSRVASLGFNADARDGLGGVGVSTVSMRLSVGELDIASPAERALDAVAGRIDGSFGKLEFAVARFQQLGGTLSLHASVRGQIAFGNLDTSEKMELGGAYGVRAYPEGEAFGDQGVIATAEARLGLGRWMPFLPGDLQAIAFVDAGVVQFTRDEFLAGDNRGSRSGVGAGLSATLIDSLILKGTYAHRLGSQRVTSGPDSGGRFWFQLVKLF